MNNAVLTLSILTLGLFVNAAQAGDGKSNPCAAEHLVGEWLTPNRTFVVAIREDDGVFSGTIVRLTDEFWRNPERARHRHDERARARIDALIGTELLSGFRCDDGRWRDGTVYVPDKDRRVDASIEVDGREFELTVKRGFMKRTKTWTRVDSPEGEED